MPFKKEQPGGLCRLHCQKKTTAASLRGHCPVQGGGGPVWTKIDATMIDAKKRTRTTFIKQTLFNTFYVPVLGIKKQNQ